MATDANFVSRIRSLISMRRDPDTAIDAAMPEKLFLIHLNEGGHVAQSLHLRYSVVYMRVISSHPTPI